MCEFVKVTAYGLQRKQTVGLDSIIRTRYYRGWH